MKPFPTSSTVMRRTLADTSPLISRKIAGADLVVYYAIYYPLGESVTFISAKPCNWKARQVANASYADFKANPLGFVMQAR